MHIDKGSKRGLGLALTPNLNIATAAYGMCAVVLLWKLTEQ